MTTFLLIDGFDVYPNVDSTSYGLSSRWLPIVSDESGVTYGNVGFASGRFGGQALNMSTGTGWGGGNPSGGIGFALAAELSGFTDLCINFAFQLNAPILSTQIMQLFNGGPAGTNVCGLSINSSQQVCFYVGGINVAAAALPLTTGGAWHLLELQVHIAPSGGTANVYIDGIEAITFTGNTGTLSADLIGIGSTPGASFAPFVQPALGLYDDIYVAEGVTRIGERRIQTIYPISDGTVAWTPLTGDNFSEVNEPQNTGDASYVYTATAATQDLYNMGTIAAGSTIIDAVQTRVSARKDDATSRVLNGVLKSNSTTVDGANWAVSGGYLYDIDIWTTDPHTSAAWTLAAVDAIQVGQKLIS